MKTNLKKAAVMVAMAIVSAGCGRTHFDHPTIEKNEPPPITLSEYAHIELKPMTFAPSVLSQEKEKLVRKVANKLDGLLLQQIQGMLATWNADTDRSHTLGSLTIQPVITQLKYVTKGQRIWAKSMYGNSGIVVELQIIDDANGAPVHSATFFGGAYAEYGSWSEGWGEQEESMLKSISERIVRYVVKNYEEPYGGPVSY